jgi:hypothetical protein
LGVTQKALLLDRLWQQVEWSDPRQVNLLILVIPYYCLLVERKMLCCWTAMVAGRMVRSPPTQHCCLSVSFIVIVVNDCCLLVGVKCLAVGQAMVAGRWSHPRQLNTAVYQYRSSLLLLMIVVYWLA